MLRMLDPLMMVTTIRHRSFLLGPTIGCRFDYVTCFHIRLSGIGWWKGRRGHGYQRVATY
eukprot:jgi/Botrbrau1/5095/Bobra.0128s0006.1